MTLHKKSMIITRSIPFSREPISRAAADRPMLSRYKKVSQQQLSETVRNYMYAIIKTGGKQYRVSEGDLLKVELLGDVKVGDKVTLSEVLAVGEGKEL